MALTAEELFQYRRSTRKYQEKQITEEQLEKILAAAQNAPLAMGNRKKTHLTVVQDPELLDAIRACCQVESRKHPGTMLDSFHGAPTAIFVSEAGISEDRIELCDAACIIENMMLEATNLGLGCCYIWGCLPLLKADRELTACLKLPKGHEILSGFVCGTPVKPLYAKEREPFGVTRI